VATVDALERWLARHHSERPTFRIAEVARLLGVSRGAIVMAERAGRIPRGSREVGGDDRIYFAEDIARLRDYFRR
jgi:DNA-binding transcriptional MerR regulator